MHFKIIPIKWTLVVLMCLFFFKQQSIAQNVGIGTQSPNSKAILDIKANDRGVLFPILTTSQRDGISNPPDGLHIFNKDERCLNFYDSAFAVWNCYCDADNCKIVTIRISANVGNLDFYNVYAINYPQARKFSILVDEGVVISNGINFINLPSSGYQIKIVNRGGMYGAGGRGGNGAAGEVSSCTQVATSGGAGTNAINTKVGVAISIDNYGIIAGGGGGGGGGGRTTSGQYGGGGGGGAGSTFGAGGSGGGTTTTLPLGGCVLFSSIAQNGTPGTISTGGPGGNGASGGSTGGNGAGLAQIGQTGIGTGGGSGGAAGKAIASVGGSSGTVINNIAGGQVIGVVE